MHSTHMWGQVHGSFLIIADGNFMQLLVLPALQLKINLSSFECARGHELLYLHLHSVDWRAHLGLALPRVGSAMSLAAAVACAQFLPPHPSSRLKELTGGQMH
jgi:hypothetical protein